MMPSISKIKLSGKNEEDNEINLKTEEDQKRAEIGKLADRALLVAGDLESLAGPPALINIQKQEEAGKLRKTFQSTAKRETTAQYTTQFLEHSQNTRERLTKPLLTPFADSMDHQDLTTGDAIHGTMLTAKMASLGVLGRVAAQNPIATAVTAGVLFAGKCTADVVAVGVDATLEAISPPAQKALEKGIKSAGEWIDKKNTLPATLENKYGVSKEWTHGFYGDVAGFAACGAVKVVSKVAGSKILEIPTSSASNITADIANIEQKASSIMTPPPALSRGVFTDAVLGEGAHGPQTLSISSEFLGIAKEIKQTGNPQLGKLHEVLRKFDQIPKGRVEDVPSGSRLFGLCDHVFSQNIAGFEKVRERIAPRLFQNLQEGAPVKWLSDQEIATHLFGAGAKPDAYTKGTFFHGTSFHGLKGILQSGELNITTKHGSKRGAWVSDLFIKGSEYGDHVLIFNRSVAWVHNPSPNRVLPHTFGFEGKIPVTVDTLEGIAVAGKDGSYHRFMEEIIPTLAGRHIPIINADKMKEAVLRREELIGRPVPSSWKDIKPGFGHQDLLNKNYQTPFSQKYVPPGADKK